MWLRYDYVEGTNSSPVGCLEGVFIKEEFRKKDMQRNFLNAVKTKGGSKRKSKKYSLKKK